MEKQKAKKRNKTKLNNERKKSYYRKHNMQKLICLENKNKKANYHKQ